MKYVFVPALLLAGCAGATSPLPFVMATVETAPVGSLDDAADDPAIWVNPADAGGSLIFGTDKKAGLYVYDLSGAVKQFLPAGKLNNVDLRQNVSAGDWRGDIAAATNRSDDTVSLFTVTGGVADQSGAIPSALAEPYGLCMGAPEGKAVIFVTYKTGDVVAYPLTGAGAGVEGAHLKLETQLEGCVFDDETGALYIGEEDRGIWKAAYAGDVFGALMLVDEVGGASGIAADVESLALYRTGPQSGFLIASSQGNYSYAVYERDGENRFLGRFEVVDGPAADGAQETDGIEAISAPLGEAFPEGVLIVQDGFNDPKGSAQNFKVIDWRAVKAALGLE